MNRDLGSSLGFRKQLYYTIIHTPYNISSYSIQSCGLAADFECFYSYLGGHFCHLSTLLI